jgi:hypothetical protein
VSERTAPGSVISGLLVVLNLLEAKEEDSAPSGVRLAGLSLEDCDE